MGCNKKSCIATILTIGMLTSTSFANAGGHSLNSDCKKEKTIKIIKEKKSISREIKKDKKHKENILKTKEGKEAYKVLNKTFLLDKPSEDGKVIEELDSEQVIYLINSYGGYGLFITKDSNKGFVKLDDVNDEPEELVNVTIGISKVTKRITNENKYNYNLVKGDNVLIKDYDENNKKYIIVDEFGNEFKLISEYISLNGNPAIASRNENFNSKGSLENTYNERRSIEKSYLKNGDLLYFRNQEGNFNVGLYLEENKIIYPLLRDREIKIPNVDSMNLKNVNIRKIITR
ncbi:NlpC/P60 family protein [Anaerosalibacter massiliensis]|uniref:C40 family peptidase n=1 Tax=Anaerosalibacter massiliensis TaxID=1347392 RepID=A0A9X2MGX9_9FIRM|nr:NlpC/P60 family protein [Anaerosalibacter massiliensis]MCR2042972.1 C40 family peptidase [Anaerosalibacter massiliensis]